MSVIKENWKNFEKYSNLNLEHSNRSIGKILSHKWMKTENGNDGLWIRAKVFEENNDDVIERINSGELRSFSIGGWSPSEGVTTTCNNKGQCIRDITRMKLFEISLVPSPANPESVVTKVK